MNWFSKIEQKFSRFAIPKLMLYVLILYVVGGVILFVRPDFYYYWLSLDPQKILQGQVWRLVTFLVYPPSTSILWIAFACFMYYSIGIVLEQVWGAFRFNLYFFGGVLATIAATFLAYFITGNNYGMLTNTNYICLTMFLAYAVTFPENRFMIFFIIPVKAKYLAILDIVLYAIQTLQAIDSKDWGTVIMIVVSLLNFLVFFLVTRKAKAVGSRRARNFKKEVKKGQKLRIKMNGALHECSVCGITDKDNPNMNFRYCSKCAGSCEYCEDHLYTHKHVTNDDLLGS